MSRVWCKAQIGLDIPKKKQKRVLTGTENVIPLRQWWRISLKKWIWKTKKMMKRKQKKKVRDSKFEMIRKQWEDRMQFILDEFAFGPYREFRDADNRPHRVDGPAIISPTKVSYYIEGRRHGPEVDIGGTIIYYFKNVIVPKRFYLTPETVTVEEILRCKNAEVRRIGLEVYGFERMIQEGRFRLVDEHKDSGACLYMFIDKKKHFEENVCIIKVLDGSMNDHGERREYILQVPPNTKTAWEAVSWTFRKETKAYAPTIEA